MIVPRALLSAAVAALPALAGCDVGGRANVTDGTNCAGFCAFEPSAPAPSGSPVARHGRLRVAGTTLLDESGQPLQLKGVSSMWLNWELDGYAENRGGLKWMRDNWNIDVVRASMGVDAAGAYLENPLRAKLQVQRVVRHAIELGLYVIVDWHDHEAAERQDEAEAFFTEFSQYYGEFPNVIYETFNEPLKVSWSQVLKPYHEGVVAALRAVDPDNVIVLGTPQWSQLVDEAALDPVAGENLMYTLHFYACEHTQWLRDGAETALGLGLPLFVTEWGATDADGGTASPRLCEDEAQLWHDWMNGHGISWAAWKLDGCREASCLLRPNAPTGGPFDDDQLQGHGFFVRDKLLE